MPAFSPDSPHVPELHPGLVPALEFEASTAEEALAQVAERLGSEAEIVSVEKVLRGGIGGFFAREVVQITARPRETAATTAAPTDVQRVLSQLASGNHDDERSFAETLRAHLAPGAAGASSIRPPDAPPSLLRAVTEAEAPIEVTGAAASRVIPTEPVAAAPQQIVLDDDLPAPRAVAPAPLPPLPPRQAPAAQPVAQATATAVKTWPPVDPPQQPAVAEAVVTPAVDAIPTPAPAAAPKPAPAAVATSAPAPTPAPAAAPAVPSMPHIGSDVAPGMPDWSADNLRRLGLPPLVTDAVENLDPRDDLAWVYAIGKAVASMCRPLPAGDAVLAGPRATKFAAPWKLSTVRPGGQPPRRGSFVAPVRDTEQGRSWLAWAKGARWLHLVVGGDRWRDFLFDEPLAVSWVGNDTLPEAITLSANLGLVLGWGMDARDPQPRRANPVDVAMTIRAMVPKR